MAASSHSIPKPGLSGIFIKPFSLPKGSLSISSAQSNHSNQWAVCETKDCYAIQRAVNINGQKSRTTFMAVFKHEKLHRAILQIVPIN